MSGAPKLIQPQPWHLDLDVAALNPGAPLGIDSQCVGIADALAPERTLHFAVTANLTHVVQRQGHCFAEEMRAAENLVAAPASFREFPLCSILHPGHASPALERVPLLSEINFSSSAHKRDVMASVTSTLQDRHSQTMVEDLLAVTDELFTNAIYNAPFVDLGSGANPGVSRQDQNEIKYTGDKSSRMVLAADGTRLVIGCEDPFGSLNLPRYLHRIKETYVRGPAATMTFGPGGAGLGSYIIFNAGASLYFGVWPGIATVIYCVIPLGMSYRKRTLLPKHLHWIQG